MTLPLISVIIPNYNCEKYIEQCIESVVKQTYKNIEILIIDDGSTDNSAALYRKFSKDDRIKTIFQNNQGLSAARNKGISISRGEYLTFIDSDDFFENDMIENLVKCIQKNDSQISICGYNTISNNSIIKHKGQNILLYKENAIFELCSDKVIKNFAWGKLYKRELFESISYPIGKKFEDIYVTWKLFDLTERIEMCEYIGYNYRLREDSISHNKELSTSFDRLNAFSTMFQEIKEKYPDFSLIVLERILYCYILLARNYVKATRNIKKESFKDIQSSMSLVKEMYKNSIKDLDFINRFGFLILIDGGILSPYLLLLFDLIRRLF